MEVEETGVHGTMMVDADTAAAAEDGEEGGMVGATATVAAVVDATAVDETAAEEMVVEETVDAEVEVPEVEVPEAEVPSTMGVERETGLHTAEMAEAIEDAAAVTRLRVEATLPAVLPAVPAAAAAAVVHFQATASGWRNLVL